MKRTTEQLPLAFTHQAQSGRDDLLVSDRMRAAVLLVDAWPQWPSPVVILTGPVGSGKSHLAGIWRETASAVSIDPQAGSECAQIAATHPVVFEDADRRGFDDQTLFHVINSVRENGTFLMMTSRLWPLSWPVSLADLRSRLKAATTVEIGEPDDDLLAQVLVKLFADRQLVVEDKLIGYIVARMERSLDAAQTIVDSLDRLALGRGVRISRALAHEVLATLGNPAEND